MKFFGKTGPNHDGYQMVMEKSSQTEIRCRYLHQTDFRSSHRRSQKTRNSKGFCEDNLPLQMSEQNSQGRGMTDLASSSDTCPSRAGRQFLAAYQNQWWLLFQHTPPAVIKADKQFQQKEDAARKGCILKQLFYTYSSISGSSLSTSVPPLLSARAKEMSNYQKPLLDQGSIPPFLPQQRTGIR